MRPWLRLLDAGLLILWHACRVAVEFCRESVGRLFRMGSRRRRDQAWSSRSWHTVLAGAADLGAEAWEALAERLDRSAAARRWFFLGLLLLFVLWWYPPSHWGPWHHYQQGVASTYGRDFFFQRTANGEWFFPGKVCAAHRSLPLGSTIKVVNRENGRKLVLRVVDRGPFVKGRTLDLSRAAAQRLGMLEEGLCKVDIYTRSPQRP